GRLRRIPANTRLSSMQKPTMPAPTGIGNLSSSELNLPGSTTPKGASRIPLPHRIVTTSSAADHTEARPSAVVPDLVARSCVDGSSVLLVLGIVFLPSSMLISPALGSPPYGGFSAPRGGNAGCDFRAR